MRFGALLGPPASPATRGWTSLLVPILAAAGTLLVSPTARAGYITDQLGAAGPGNFAIFALGGTNLSSTAGTLNGPGQTTGNVGVASAGNIALNSSTPPAIIGNLYLGNTVTTSGSSSPVSGQVSGTIFTNQDGFLGTGSSTGFWTGGNTTATGAVSDALNAAKTFAGLSANQTVSNITSNTTLTAGTLGPNNTWVVNVTGNINLGNNEVLTLSGAAGTQFILNVAGTITLNGGNNFSGGEIRLAGGLTAADVVINVTSTSSGDNVTTSGGSSPDPNNPGNTLPNASIQGILLDVAGGIGMAPGAVYGEIIGGGNEIRLVSGSEVQGAQGAQVSGVPEPSTLVLALTGVAGIGLAGLRRVRQRRAVAA
jgi:hypothetical protein